VYKAQARLYCDGGWWVWALGRL